METNKFIELAAVNVNDHVEKKGSLSYLSWAWAVDQLLRRDPFAGWEYGQPDRYGDTMMVYCTVVAFGQARTMQLPVMDHRNKAIANPDAFQVNTAMQRCLVKAIALHGLGLYIYAGEDLPEGETAPEDSGAAVIDRIKAGKPHTGKQTAQDEFDRLDDGAKQVVREWALEIIADVEAGDVDKAIAFAREHCGGTHEDELALASQLPSNVANKMKARKRQLELGSQA